MKNLLPFYVGVLSNVDHVVFEDVRQAGETFEVDHDASVIVEIHAVHELLNDEELIFFVAQVDHDLLKGFDKVVPAVAVVVLEPPFRQFALEIHGEKE